MKIKKTTEKTISSQPTLLRFICLTGLARYQNERISTGENAAIADAFKLPVIASKSSEMSRIEW